MVNVKNPWIDDVKFDMHYYCSWQKYAVYALKQKSEGIRNLYLDFKFIES